MEIETEKARDLSTLAGPVYNARASERLSVIVGEQRPLAAPGRRVPACIGSTGLDGILANTRRWNGRSIPVVLMQRWKETIGVGGLLTIFAAFVTYEAAFSEEF